MPHDVLHALQGHGCRTWGRRGCVVRATGRWRWAATPMSTWQRRWITTPPTVGSAPQASMAKACPNGRRQPSQSASKNKAHKAPTQMRFLNMGAMGGEVKWQMPLNETWVKAFDRCSTRFLHFGTDKSHWPEDKRRLVQRIGLPAPAQARGCTSESEPDTDFAS